MKLRLGIIGHGDIWKSRHAPSLRVLHDRFDVRAVFSTVAKLAENMAGEFQADAVEGYRSLVNRCDIDAVIVLQRTWLGWLPMLAACEAGKAVYWAGDLDLNVHRDQSLRNSIEASGVSFMVEFPRRFAPATLRLKELIATRLGKPKMIFCHRRMLEHEAACHDLHVDPVRRELIELTDWCHYVVGRPADSVTSIKHQSACSAPLNPSSGNPNSGNPNSGSDGSHAMTTDYRCLSLAFNAADDSPAVTAQLSCGSYIPDAWKEAMGFRAPAGMHICCEHGIAFVDLPSGLVWFDEAGRNMESLDTEMPVGQQLLSHFHRSVTSLLRNSSDLDDAFAAAKILAAADESEETRQWVSL